MCYVKNCTVCYVKKTVQSVVLNCTARSVNKLHSVFLLQSVVLPAVQWFDGDQPLIHLEVVLLSCFLVYLQPEINTNYSQTQCKQSHVMTKVGL